MAVYIDRFLLFSLVAGFFLFPSLLSAQKDHYKAYLKAPGHENPERLQANQLILGPNGKELFIVAELKAANPDYSNHAIVIHTTAEGAVQQTHALKSNTQNDTDGVRGASLTLDSDGNIYVGGGHTGTWNPLGTGAERTLTALDTSGKIKWSGMQSSFFYAGIDYDIEKDRIIAISGPTNLANPNYNIQLSEFAKDGKMGATFSLQTQSQDYGKEVISLPTGFAFAGTSYEGTSKKALIGFVDTDFNLDWALTFADTDLNLEVSAMAYHPQGVFGISGTSEDSKTGHKQAFLLGLGTNAEVVFFKLFDIGQGASNEATGISPYTHRGEHGFIMAGFYHKGSIAERRSMLIKTDLEGQTLWANNYSPYKPQDNTYDEVLRDVIYMESEGIFVAAGDLRRYKNGLTLDRKALILIRAGINDGKLNEGEDCFETLGINSVDKILLTERVGTGISLPDAAIGFSYQQPSVEFYTGYCSFGPAPEVETPEEEIRSPWGGIDLLGDSDYGKEKFDVYKSGISSIRIETRDLIVRSSIIAEVFDIQGQLLKRTNLSPNKQHWELDLPSIAFGMYFVKISDQNLQLNIERMLLGE